MIYDRLFDKVFKKKQHNGKIWPLRKDGKTVEDMLMKRLAIQYRIKKDNIEGLSETIFDILIGWMAPPIEYEAVYVFKYVNKQGTMVSCKELMMAAIKQHKESGKEVTTEFLDELYTIINDSAMEHYRKVKHLRGISGNILLYINHIVREMVIRIPINGKGPFIVPSPVGNFEITKEELIEHGFGPVFDLFIKVSNRALLESVFNTKFRDRMERLGFLDGKKFTKEAIEYRDALIAVILNGGLAIDIALDKVHLGEEHIIYHMRKEGIIEGTQDKRGPGMYTGEHTIKALSKPGVYPELKAIGMTSNVEYFAQVLLEEAQHVVVHHMRNREAHGHVHRHERGKTKLSDGVEHDYAIFGKGTSDFTDRVELDHGIVDGVILDEIMGELAQIEEKVSAAKAKNKISLQQQSNSNLDAPERHFTTIQNRFAWFIRVGITARIRQMEELSVLAEA